MHACRVCNGTQSPHRSFLYIRNVISTRYLAEMFAAHEYVVEFLLPPHMFRCRDGCLSQAHSQTAYHIIRTAGNIMTLSTVATEIVQQLQSFSQPTAPSLSLTFI